MRVAKRYAGGPPKGLAASPRQYPVFLVIRFLALAPHCGTPQETQKRLLHFLAVLGVANGMVDHRCDRSGHYFFRRASC